MGDDSSKSNAYSFHAALEKEFIIDYLGQREYRLQDLKNLNPILRKKVLTQACRHAALKLAEIESRSHFIDKLHHIG